MARRLAIERFMKFSSFNPTAAKRAAMAIADRGLLGAVTFLTSIILGRWGGPGELGLFAIFFSVVFLALAVQESFTIAPYNLLAAARSDGAARRRYLGGVLIDTLLLSGILSALLLLAAAVLWAVGWSHAAAIALVLVPAAPCILVREFARRVVYADFRPQAAMVISAGVSVLQVALMGCFYAFGRLDAAASFAAMGASSFVGAVAWFYADRATIEFIRQERADWYREHWELGRWLLAGQASEIVRTNMLPWLLALGADEATVGIYAACSFVASLPTPLHVAISNMLVPQMAHLERRSGLMETDRLVRQATGWLTATMMAYAAVVILFSAQLVPWIYGEKFTNTQHPLIVLVLAWAITGATLPAARALLVIKRPDQMLWSQLAGIAVNLALGLPMVYQWGAAGAAYAALFGSAIKGVLGNWWYATGVRRLLDDERGKTSPHLEGPHAREMSWAGSGPSAFATEGAP